ncbi:hypothetical protein [Deinococcus saxicola]|uniref:hypothetical protein n=1 Tax=Deinococcus saxicola TaxID=249406 RepID=UPI0039EE39FA
MVVAIAPYVNLPHPCKTYCMSGCQGELVKKPILPPGCCLPRWASLCARSGPPCQ